MITTSRILELGFSKELISSYVREEIEKQGVYCLSNEVYDDMYALTLSSKNIVFSHDTALFLNDVSERMPFIHTITILLNTFLPNLIKNKCLCFYIKPELYNVGITIKKTTFRNEVKCYNLERTICDILCSRKIMDEESIISAIRNYAMCKQKDLNRLYEYANQFHLTNQLKQYLEVLV